MTIKRKKAYFSISAVADMFSIHQQTVRLYEKQGLINPKRSSGNTRLFSEEDVERLEEVIHLTHELGINLAGVEMILKLKKQIQKMQNDMNKIFNQAQDQLEKEREVSKEAIQSSVSKLMRIKKIQKHTPALTTSENNMLSNTHKNSIEASGKAIDEPVELDSDNWEIDYDE